MRRWNGTTASNSQEEWYLYDASGNRVLRRSATTAPSGNPATAAATITVYAFGLEEHVYSYTGSGTSLTNTSNTYYYNVGGRPIGTLSGATSSSLKTSFLLTDTLGSVVTTISNTAGSATVLGTQLYGPYGNKRSSAGSMGTAKGYTGHYNDDVTGLDYYNARYYDPLIGRFLSADVVQGNLSGMDPYNYVGGNPETNNDPTGHLVLGSNGQTAFPGGGTVVTPAPAPYVSAVATYLGQATASGSNTGSSSSSDSSLQPDTCTQFGCKYQALLNGGTQVRRITVDATPSLECTPGVFCTTQLNGGAPSKTIDIEEDVPIPFNICTFGFDCYGNNGSDSGEGSSKGSHILANSSDGLPPLEIDAGIMAQEAAETLRDLNELQVENGDRPYSAVTVSNVKDAKGQDVWGHNDRPGETHIGGTAANRKVWGGACAETHCAADIYKALQNGGHVDGDTIMLGMDHRAGEMPCGACRYNLQVLANETHIPVWIEYYSTQGYGSAWFDVWPWVSQFSTE